MKGLGTGTSEEKTMFWLEEPVLVTAIMAGKYPVFHTKWVHTYKMLKCPMLSRPPPTDMKVSSCNVNVKLHVKNDIDMICLKQRLGQNM